MTRIFLDSASIDEMREFAPQVEGFTTNPTLMRKAGVADYMAWAAECASLGKPVSLEVISDDHNEMMEQAKRLAALGEHIFVKIPVTNTKGEFSGRILKKLSRDGVKLNVTAILAREQVKAVVKALDKRAKAIISVFAGRIADTGVDPRGAIKLAVRITRQWRGFDVLWASPRQVLDIETAERVGCDIITVSPEILRKREMKGRNLAEYSRETVEQFYRDAVMSGYTLL